MKKNRRETSVPGEPYVYNIEMHNGKRWVFKSYRVQRKFRTASGRRKTFSKTFTRLESALSFRDSLDQTTELNLAEKGFLAQSCDFKSVFERFLKHKRFEAGLQPTSIQKYEQTGQHLEFFNRFDFANIDSAIVDAWINCLRSEEYMKLQSKTRESYKQEYDLLRTVINYYIEFENEDFRSPILKRHKKRLCMRPRNAKRDIKFLDFDQQQSLALLLAEDITDQKKVTLAKLMRIQLETGMRIGEVAALQGDQLNFRKEEIYVDRHLQWDRTKGGQIRLAKGTKGGATRIIYMTSECKRILESIRDFAKCPLFSDNGGWYSYRKIQYYYRRKLSAAGSSSYGTHSLRHTFAVNFLRKTKDIHALQKLLGHTDLETTQVYAKYSDESTRHSFQIYDNNVLPISHSSDSQNDSHKIFKEENLMIST